MIMVVCGVYNSQQLREVHVRSCSFSFLYSICTVKGESGNEARLLSHRHLVNFFLYS